MTSLIGQVIGNYRLDTLLGAGGMGQVYRARHVHLDTVAAVTVMHEHVAYDPKFQSSFRDEARNAHRLVHPNIVKIHDFGDQDGRFYLVMELVTDGSLRVLLQGLQKLPLPLALDLVRQAAEGLAFAQSRGMVHRDLKPDNLLLSREGRTERQEYVVKISDFGLSKLASGNSQGDQSCDSGPCPLTVQFVGTIQVPGPGTFAYTFERSDGATARVNRIQFTEAGTQQLTTSWVLGRSFSGWQRLKIVSPTGMATTSEPARFTVTCG